jgi:hypothetical protein
LIDAVSHLYGGISVRVYLKTTTSVVFFGLQLQDYFRVFLRQSASTVRFSLCSLKIPTPSLHRFLIFSFTASPRVKSNYITRLINRQELAQKYLTILFSLADYRLKLGNDWDMMSRDVYLKHYIYNGQGTFEVNRRYAQ